MFSSVRFGSVRFGRSSPVGSGPVSCLVLSSRVPRLWALRPSSPRLAPPSGGLSGPVPSRYPSSVRFGSVRFSSIQIGPFQLPVPFIDPVSLEFSPIRRLLSIKFRLIKLLGQVPAERSLDASVRFRRSGRSTPRSGSGGAVARRLGPVPPRYVSCLVWAMHPSLYCSAPLAGRASVRYSAVPQLGSVRFGSIQIGPLQLSVPFIS